MGWCNFREQPPPKMVPRTIENTREFDETICRPDDEEVCPYACLILQINQGKRCSYAFEVFPLKIWCFLWFGLKLFAGNDVDEFSAILRKERDPKILITTSRYNSTVSLYFVFPYCFYSWFGFELNSTHNWPFHFAERTSICFWSYFCDSKCSLLQTRDVWLEKGSYLRFSFSLSVFYLAWWYCHIDTPYTIQSKEVVSLY